MPKIKIDTVGLHDLSVKTSSIKNQINECRNSVETAANRLDWQVSSKSSIEERLKRIQSKLQKQAEQMGQYAKVLNTASDSFINSDNKLKQDSKNIIYELNNISSSIGAVAAGNLNPRLNHNLEEKWGQIHSIGSIFGFVAGGSMITDISRFKVSLAQIMEAGLGAKSKTDNISQLRTKRIITNSIDYLSPGKEKQIQYSGNVKKDIKDYYDNWIDGQRNVAKNKYEYETHGSTQRDSFRIFGESFDYTKTNDIVNVYGSVTEGEHVHVANGSMTKISQRITLNDTSSSAVNLDLNKVDLYGMGEFDIGKGNVYGSAGAKYTVASAEISGKSDLGEVTVGASAGVGLSVNAGVHDGTLEFGADIGLGIGAKVNVKINYGEIWEGVKDLFKWG